jgi:undecaprenyl-diphosphatase
MKYFLAIIGLVFLTLFAIAYDIQIFSAIRSIQTPALDVSMAAITSIATFYIGLPVIVAFLIIKRQKKATADLVIALAIGLVISFLIKLVIMRPRPEDISFLSCIVSANFSSFPSDHSLIAFTMAVIFSKHFKKYKSWFFSLACLIGLSRIYLGVHYPTDVLAGAYLGLIVAWLTLRYKLGGKALKIIGKR